MNLNLSVSFEKSNLQHQMNPNQMIMCDAWYYIIAQVSELTKWLKKEEKCTTCQNHS